MIYLLHTELNKLFLIARRATQVCRLAYHCFPKVFRAAWPPEDAQQQLKFRQGDSFPSSKKWAACMKHSYAQGNSQWKIRISKTKTGRIQFLIGHSNSIRLCSLFFIVSPSLSIESRDHKLETLLCNTISAPRCSLCNQPQASIGNIPITAALRKQFRFCCSIALVRLADSNSVPQQAGATTQHVSSK